MISLVKELPEINSLSAEWIKIKCLFDAYKNDDKVLFWCQDNNKAIISMTDGNMIILNIDADTEELKEFCDMLFPACVFSDYDTLLSLGRKPEEKINIMYRKADIKSEKESDFLKSDEIYRLLD